MQTRTKSGGFSRILLTRTLDPLTGNLLQGDNLSRSQVAQATTQTQSAKLFVQLIDRKSRVAQVVRGVKHMQRGEKFAKSQFRNVDLVTYISISNVLVPNCWCKATTTKIWNCLPQFFSSPKF